MTDLPEPDRVEGAPHPRDCVRLIGQEGAEAEVLDAFVRGRMHHGWLLAGPRGVGKASLAWKIARFLLATPDPGGGLFGAGAPPDSLEVSPDHPVARRMAAGAEGRLFVLRRSVDEKTHRLRAEIGVEDVRRMKQVFSLSSADGGWRVAIVDCADEMTRSAANALLKLLEEPPEKVVILLISHRPSGLLPTIRSRCRTLRLGALSADQIAQAMVQAGVEVPSDPAALAELAGGSVGEAIRLVQLDGLGAYARLIEVLAAMPDAPRPLVLALAESVQGKGADARFDLVLGLIEQALARLARRGVMGQALPDAAVGESKMLARLAPDARAGRIWADLAQELSLRARRGRAVNLDAAALVLDTMLRLDAAAARVQSGASR